MGDDALSAGAVARRLGVAVTTLRTWHRRYGLGPSRHVPGQHRRYTAQDLDRLEVMLRLTSQGVAPAEAAAWARRSTSSAGFASSSAGSASSPAGLAPLLAGSAPLLTGSAPSPAPSPASPAPSPAGPGGGGQAIPLGPAVPAARGFARAAMRLDAPVMRTILERAVGDWGVVRAWDDVAVPVLVGIGERYQATQRFVEVEHLISRCISEVLGAVPRPRAASPARVLLAAADEEQHTLPLEALAAALAQAGVPTRMLGGRVPPPALDDAITRTGPAAVVLWSQIGETGDAAQLARVREHPHPPLLVAAGGPGWRPRLPAGVAQLTTLAEAVELVCAAVR
ncbi:MerR family transcriptional regulator [Actinoplanes sp. NPDC051513]|uniref:MerR family transcriptional regulator n=1 Tax=Actinoplanes sp. NPDC051513 TaxID=3363908 RepID=UPI0037AE1092